MCIFSGIFQAHSFIQGNLTIYVSIFNVSGQRYISIEIKLLAWTAIQSDKVPDTKAKWRDGSHQTVSPAPILPPLLYLQPGVGCWPLVWVSINLNV